MNIVVFTSSFPRHRYLVNLLSQNFKKLIYVCEKKPYIRSEVTKKKQKVVILKILALRNKLMMK